MSYFGHYFGSYMGEWYGAQGEIGGGGYVSSPYRITRTFTKLKDEKDAVNDAQDLVSEIISEFSENRYSEIYEKAAFTEIKSAIPKYQFLHPIMQEVVPQDVNYITYENLLMIRQMLNQEYLRLRLLNDDEEVLLAVFTN